MNLRRQLLLVSLLLLALPWAGCQFTREIEGAMRQGQQNALLDTAHAVARLVAAEHTAALGTTNSAVTGQHDGVIYAFPTRQPVIVDGYDDGWEDTPGIRFDADSGDKLAMTARARTRGDTLFLLLRVFDNQVRYHHPALPDPLNGDRLLLRLGAQERPRDYVINTAAPGSVRARPVSRSARSDEAARIRGFWQDTEGGYTLELELPVALAGHFLGLVAIDDTGEDHYAGNVDPSTHEAPPPLITRPPAARQLLAPFAGTGRELMLADKRGWLLGAVAGEARVESSAGADTFWLLQLLYRYILAQEELTPPPAAKRPGKLAGQEVQVALAGRDANARYRDPTYTSRSIQSVAVPVYVDESVAGAVVIRESGETYLSLTDRAFSRLIGYSLVAIGAAALGLLGYASLLSWRIRRLSKAVNDAIGEDGVVNTCFIPSSRGDEIGDLSRHYASLLARVREYNDYLRTLSRKLSHELRTPIAVIQSSLDNLDALPGTGQDGKQDEYKARARDGLSRLQGILAAMSEANRLEESIRADELVVTDLAPMLGGLWSSYRDIYGDHALTVELPASPAKAAISPDLLVQALDKIVDNAASFCPHGGKIELALRDAGDCWAITVDNDGPTLAQDSIGQLFDPMVSLRETGSTEVHLGLGLHIVRLVTEFHRGRVRAENRPDGSGVIVTLALPKVLEH